MVSKGDLAGKLVKTAAQKAGGSKGSAHESKKPSKNASDTATTVDGGSATAAQPDASAGNKRTTSTGGLKDTLKSTAAGAAKGATTGGAHGAAIGAAKNAAISIGKSRTGRNTIIAVVAVIAVVVLFSTTTLISAGVSFVGLLTGANDENSSQSAEESGVEQDSISDAIQASDRTGLPWEIVSALDLLQPDTKLSDVVDALQDEDPQRQHRDLRTGATHSTNTATLTIPDEGTARDQADQVQETYVNGLTATGMDKDDALAVFKLALSWALAEDQCTPTGDVGNSDGDASKTSFAGQDFDPAQISIMKTIIGIAKTMHPDDAEQASVIALITARVESGFKNYANDGKVGSEDAGADTSRYAELAYSLNLDHDAVGTDHASLGIMQQQATASWGDTEGSSWGTDPKGVIERLMDPAFASARFLQKLQLVTDWQSKKPGEVAQDIQVSAHPDRYQQQVKLAQEIWDALAGSSPALDLPAGIGGGPGDTSGGNDRTTPEGCGDDAGGAVPTGDAQELAKQIMTLSDQGKIFWWGSHPAEYKAQVQAYADGAAISDECTIDTRIFQVIVFAADMFDVLSVNSLNRRCTGSELGAGKASKHWQGKAVDFGYLGGTSTTGGDANSVKLLMALSKIVPEDAGFGQQGCNGRSVDVPQRLFADSCTHFHFEFGDSDTALNTGEER